MDSVIFRALRARGVRGALVMIGALAAPVVCAALASRSGQWELFERSGSITTACGLLLASRRYIRYGVVELTLLEEQKRQAGLTEIIEDIFTAKEGLALSAVGTIIWGWGAYLRWWSFLCLLLCAIFAGLNARSDLKNTGRLAHTEGPGHPSASP